MRLWFWNKHWKHSTLWISWKTLFLGGKHSITCTRSFLELWCHFRFLKNFDARSLKEKQDNYVLRLWRTKEWKTAKLIQIFRLHNNKIKTKRSFSSLFSASSAWPLTDTAFFMHEIRCLFLISSWERNPDCMQLPDEWCDCLVTNLWPGQQPLAMTRAIVLQLLDLNIKWIFFRAKLDTNKMNAISTLILINFYINSNSKRC